MRAIGRYILISEIKEDSNKVSESGLLITDKQRSDIRYRRGKILSVGSDLRLMVNEDGEPVLKDGDEVLFDRNAGFKIDHFDGIVLVIKDIDIVVVL